MRTLLRPPQGDGTASVRPLRRRPVARLRRPGDPVSAVVQAEVATGPRTLRAGGPPLLSVEGITVRFGGVTANDEVSLAIPSGTLTALIGPNGAGKTTLFNVVSGAVTPSAGRVIFDGEDVTGLSRRQLVGRGIVRTFQNLELVETASVLDNIVLGTSRYVRYAFLQGLAPRPGAGSSGRLLQTAAARALAAVGLSDWKGELAGNLPYGLRRHVEIARALAAGPRLLLLDEPSAGMDAGETADLGELVMGLVDRLGVTVLLVEHDMSMVRPYADHVHVLHQGKLISSGAPDDVLAEETVRLVYLGKAVDTHD